MTPPRTHKDWIARAHSEGERCEAGQLCFEARYSSWEQMLPFVDFSEGAPQIRLPSEFSNEHEIRGAARKFAEAARDEQPYSNRSARVGVVNDQIDELEEVFFNSATEQAVDLSRVLPTIRGIIAKLVIFLPVGIPYEEGRVPVTRFHECDKLSPQWRGFEQAVRQLAGKDADLDANFQEMVGSASYGGSPGIVAYLDGDMVADWIESGDLFAAIRGGRHERIGYGVLDFVNGSGDIQFTDAPSVDWSAIQRGETTHFRIINNALREWFGMCYSGPIDLPEALGGHRGNPLLALEGDMQEAVVSPRRRPVRVGDNRL